MRSGSRRLPGKNVRDFFGKPIFVYTLEYAKKSGVFDEVLVSTESKEYAALAEKHGFPVPFLRPSVLAEDTAKLKDVLRNALEEYARRGKHFDNVCLLWGTAPLRTVDDILGSYNLLVDGIDAVVGTTEFGLPPLCAMRESGSCELLEPMFPEYMYLSKQKMPHLVVDNGSMCWVRTKAFLQHDSWLPPKMRGYLMPAWKSIDLDTEDDWDMVEYYYQKRVIDERARHG